VPATVVMTPAGVTLRTTLFWLSAMNTSPDESTASIHGAESFGSTALPPPPATVAIALAHVGRVSLPRNGSEPA